MIIWMFPASSKEDNRKDNLGIGRNAYCFAVVMFVSSRSNSSLSTWKVNTSMERYSLLTEDFG